MSETQTDIEARVRPAVPSDMNFIYATWLRDLRHADGGPLPDDVWFGAHREFLKRILTDTKVEVLVVCASDAPNEILGYCVAEPNEVLWWVYVKPRYRGKHGLCRLLLQSSQSLQSQAGFSTLDAKSKLLNQRRPRQLRPKYNQKASASSIGSELATTWSRASDSKPRSSVI